MTNPLLHLQTFEQSIWLDFIRRGMLTSGEMQQLREDCGARGVTSNPSIFEKAIVGSRDYDDRIRALTLEGKASREIYEDLTLNDVQCTADLFRRVYDQTEGRDGFVSLEVSPDLADDATGTVEEARRLWQLLNRPNVMIKVPGTREGIIAIRQLTAEGINVNVTLLFGLSRYRDVCEAYVEGLTARLARGMPLGRVASVASFFLSRIDILVDSLLDQRRQERNTDKSYHDLLGQTAIACAKAAYEIYKELFHGERFRPLAVQGARPQRLLWASTSTKNPKESDVKYVEALIGPDTVNTLTLETLQAYRDHGRPSARLEEGITEARNVLDRLRKIGIDLEKVSDQLEEDGIRKFITAFDGLTESIERKRTATLKEPLDRQTLTLPGYDSFLQDRLNALEQNRFTSRCWRKEAALWKPDAHHQEAIRHSLGWLHVAEKMEDHLDELFGFAEEVRRDGFRRVVHMGMGGSSLAPLVFQRICPRRTGGLPLMVLDTTDPATVLKIEQEGPLADTLFIVATKSGTTAEPLAFRDYFFAKLKKIKGLQAGDNFVVITDPDSPLVKQAEERRFRRVFLNFSDIGGRYSALSYFGLVPATLMGVNVSELLVRALRMVHANAACVPVKEAPGIVLGTVMGELALHHRDKVTLLTSPSLRALGLWIEQLLAESTGKEGVGLLPVAGEAFGESSVYGDDRLFISIHAQDERDESLDRNLAALQAAGKPVVSIQLEDPLDLGQEFFRWEMAAATAGAILGINPFDQPNVQESKDNTNRLLANVEQGGGLPEESSTVVEGSLALYAREVGHSASEVLRRFFQQALVGDYVALLAYLPEQTDIEERLQAIRELLRDRLHVATTVGYGPRYLHSTGQFHKGGPNTGLFLLITADEAIDAAIPDKPYTFGVFKHAQALGDLESLRKHGRRVLRVHLREEVTAGLTTLGEALESTLASPVQESVVH
ncbi:MAG: bifunctional transaldolase/phosoglucose isomerase [Nitrospira sp.]|nr:bifunctional transaldolase/phosoglucose isomerase [Nitrospira sp.]